VVWKILLQKCTSPSSSVLSTSPSCTLLSIELQSCIRQLRQKDDMIEDLNRKLSNSKKLLDIYKKKTISKACNNIEELPVNETANDAIELSELDDLENVQQVRDIVHKTTDSLQTKPKASSIKSEHLTSFQNRMWFYNLLLGFWTPNMLSIMSKYLENHDGDGIILFYCFLKHFASATRANIIAAYTKLPEANVQLHLYNNDVSALLMPFVHRVMDCPNSEFNNSMSTVFTMSTVPMAWLPRGLCYSSWTILT